MFSDSEQSSATGARGGAASDRVDRGNSSGCSTSGASRGIARRGQPASCARTVCMAPWEFFKRALTVARGTATGQPIRQRLRRQDKQRALTACGSAHHRPEPSPDRIRQALGAVSCHSRLPLWRWRPRCLVAAYLGQRSFRAPATAPLALFGSASSTIASRGAIVADRPLRRSPRGVLAPSGTSLAAVHPAVMLERRSPAFWLGVALPSAISCASRHVAKGGSGTIRFPPRSPHGAAKPAGH